MGRRRVGPRRKRGADAGPLRAGQPEDRRAQLAEIVEGGSQRLVDPGARCSACWSFANALPVALVGGGQQRGLDPAPAGQDHVDQIEVGR